MYYKHYFMCVSCKQHIVEITDTSMPVISGRTHGKALENGAEPMARGTALASCMGLINYCPGFDKFGNLCGGNHPKGTEEFADPPQPPPNPDWQEFAQRVQAAWQLYVNSGYSIVHRGPNHDRIYKTKPAVMDVLRRSKGIVNIAGGLYKTSISLTTDASLKRNAGSHAVFIYHL